MDQNGGNSDIHMDFLKLPSKKESLAVLRRVMDLSESVGPRERHKWYRENIANCSLNIGIEINI